MPPAARRRYFVLTFGRSGSSLLCAILADAGAAFGIPAPAAWDPRHGVMEDGDIKRAAHHMRRAHDIDAGRRYLLLPQLEAKLRRNRARHYLRRSLAAVEYVKIGDLDLLVQTAFALGYEPRVILSYRDFDAILASTLVGRKHHGPDALAADYLRIYRQGLALVQTFGGCAVSYEEMLAAADGAWLDALAGVTGLARTALAAAAARRIARAAAAAPAATVVYPECAALAARLRALAGRAFAPAAPVARALAARGVAASQASPYSSAP